jgi:hypothetical protein
MLKQLTHIPATSIFKFHHFFHLKNHKLLEKNR